MNQYLSQVFNPLFLKLTPMPLTKTSFIGHHSSIDPEKTKLLLLPKGGGEGNHTNYNSFTKKRALLEKSIEISARCEVAKATGQSKEVVEAGCPAKPPAPGLMGSSPHLQPQSQVRLQHAGLTHANPLRSGSSR